jgi:hypothetical protein
MEQTITSDRGTALDGESTLSAVCWGAVAAGAFVAGALSLLLIAIGVGLGLSSVSPWSGSNPSAATFGTVTAIWIVITQLISAALGGYIAGRLRTKWVGVHIDERHFRDTAHGLIVWAVGAVIGVSLLTSAAMSLVSGGAQVAAASGIATAATTNERVHSGGYFVDMLFRSTKPDTMPSLPQPTAEVGTILAVSLHNGSISPGDKAHLAQLISARTDLSQVEAEQRIDDIIMQAKAAADSARKAAAMLAIWVAIALLVGAFSASLAATIGGRARDRV